MKNKIYMLYFECTKKFGWFYEKANFEKSKDAKPCIRKEQAQDRQATEINSMFPRRSICLPGIFFILHKSARHVQGERDTENGIREKKVQGARHEHQKVERKYA